MAITKFISAQIKKNKEQLRRELQQELKRITDVIDAPMGKQIGEIAVTEMKSLISKGISTIEGGGKFPKYSDSYREAIKRGRYTGKKITPVNLKLTGDMLNSLDSTIRETGKGVDVFVGYFDSKEALKEQGHRESINSRPTIPIGSERFSVKLERKILDALVKILGTRLRSR